MKKLTKENIESLIVSTKYHYHPQVTICVATTECGYEIVGKAGTITPEDNDPKIGEKYSYDDMISNLWALEAYYTQKYNYEQDNLIPETT